MRKAADMPKLSADILIGSGYFMLGAVSLMELVLIMHNRWIQVQSAEIKDNL